MVLAVYGKHPAKGDFLEYGLPSALKPALEGWLDTALADAKTSLGADWQAVWPTAPMLRFWLGEGIWGKPVAGVMAPSQDRVGRRFPLVLLALGDGASALPPPVIEPDQAWYDVACAHLGAQLLRDDLPGPAALVQHAPQPVMSDTLPGPADFWAVRPGADVGGLLADIALTDHRRANQGRSYWWVAGTVAVAVDNAVPIVEADALFQEDNSLSAVNVDACVDGPEGVAPDDSADAENGGDTGDWDLPDAPETGAPETDAPETGVPETDASPFDQGTAGIRLFAPPEPGSIAPTAVYSALQTHAPVVAKPQWSQVWAGPGLPSGAVLAWFFRGHAGND